MSKGSELRQSILELLQRATVTRRNELVDHLKVRPATLYDVLNQLVDEGLLSEPNRGGKRTGRRASEIYLNGEHACFLGLEVGIEYLAVGLYDLQGRELNRKFTTLPSGAMTAEERLLEINALVCAMKTDNAEWWPRLAGIAFADPGVVDHDSGRSIQAVNIPGWVNLPIVELLQERWKVPVYLTTAVDAWAYQEYQSAPENGASLFLLHLGSGVGGAFIKGGDPFSGDNCCAMEVGHIVVKENGPLCQCGNRGCLEALVGEPGIRARVEELTAGSVVTRLSDTSFSTQHFTDCVKSGDKAALSMAQELFNEIGLGLAPVIALLNPGQIMFAGPLSKLGPLLTDGVQRILNMRCIPQAVADLNLSISDYDEFASVSGAVLLLRRDYLRLEAQRR